MGSRIKTGAALSVPALMLLSGCGTAPPQPAGDPLLLGSLLIAEQHALQLQTSAYYCPLSTKGGCSSDTTSHSLPLSRADISLASSDASLPASGFLNTGPLQGYALNGDVLPNSSYGRVGLLLASDTRKAGNITAGLGWANESKRGDQLKMNLLRQQPSADNGDGQWLASLQSSVQPVTLLGKLRVEGEVALLHSDSNDTSSGDPLGARMKLSGPQGPLHYAVTMSRFGSGFAVAGSNAGQQQVAADLQYRLLKNLRLKTRTEYRERGFDEGPQRRDRRSSFTLTGTLLKPWLAAYSPTAEVQLAQANHFLPQSRLDQTVNHLDVRLSQPLANGWRYRLQLSLQDGEDKNGVRDFDRRQIQLTGDHALNFGAFAGSIGPALSMDSRTGYLERTSYKAGFEMRLRSTIQQLSLELGYEINSSANTLINDRDISFGLKYQLDV